MLLGYSLVEVGMIYRPRPLRRTGEAPVTC
jgi:hypothetical protein